MFLTQIETEATKPVENVVSVVKEETQNISNIFNIILEKVQEKIPSILFALVIFIIGFLLSKLLIRVVSGILKKSNIDRTAHHFLKSIVKIVIYTLIIVMALSIIGVPMTSIVTVIGAAGLAISLALQTSLSNLAGGFIILSSKPFKVNDYIEIDGISGTVEKISILYTNIVSVDNKISFIPNGIVANAKITNFTSKSDRRLDINIKIGYKDDYKKAQKIIMDIVEKNTLTIKTPEPLVRMGEHGSSSIVIYVKVWVMASDYWELKFQLLEEIKEEFDKNNINIPYNQMDVFIKNN
jgi:small conductance mechanosensitive channel